VYERGTKRRRRRRKFPTSHSPSSFGRGHQPKIYECVSHTAVHTGKKGVGNRNEENIFTLLSSPTAAAALSSIYPE
jgi:hypothetical protein